MDAPDTVVSGHEVLNEQIARNIFDALPERGPIVAIMDRSGRCWPSHPEEFANLNLNTTLLADLRAKVDDGVEPIFTCAQDTSVTVAQLATDTARGRYLLVAIPRCGSELTQNYLDLIESLLNQITLVASLTERNCVLNELQAKHLGIRGSDHVLEN